MGSEVHARDAAAVALWDNAYATIDVRQQGNLWGDPPVPYAGSAASLFATNSAAIVLDLPCGDGRNLVPLAAGAPIVFAGDTSMNAMSIAARVAADAGIRDRVIFSKIDVFATGLLDDSVDGVFCWDLLGHLMDAPNALRELYRVTRPGGHIVANLWTMNDCQVSDPNIREIAPKEYIDHEDFYCRFYDRDDVESLLRSVEMRPSAIEVANWWEPAHAGYRDYEHQHESLVVTVRKNG